MESSGFSITKILDEAAKMSDEAEAEPSSPQSSGSSPSMSSPTPSTNSKPLLPTTFNPLQFLQLQQQMQALGPLWMHQMASACANPEGASEVAEAGSSRGEAPRTPMEWCNAMACMNMTRQMSALGGGQGWDPRQMAWMHSLMNKTSHKRKGGQIRFTNEQTDALEETFENSRYLNNAQRKKLAKQLSLSERQVKTWFQNRRAKWRRVRPDDEGEEELAVRGHSQAQRHANDDLCPGQPSTPPQLPMNLLKNSNAFVNNLMSVPDIQNQPAFKQFNNSAVFKLFTSDFGNSPK